MSETLRAIIVGFGALGVALIWQAWQLIRLETMSPNRLISELRLAQFSALLLALTGGIYMGLAIAHEQTAGTAPQRTRCAHFGWAYENAEYELRAGVGKLEKLRYYGRQTGKQLIAWTNAVNLESKNEDSERHLQDETPSDRSPG